MFSVLVKRKKRAPKMPKRQVLCYYCGSTVVTDDDSEGAPHSYQCAACGKRYPPSPREEAELQKRRAEQELPGTARVEKARALIKSRQAKGEPLFWVSKAPRDLKSTARRSAADIAGEKELLGILKGKPDSEKKRGRKPEAAYDRAKFHQEAARLFGRKHKLADLAKKVLQHDRTSKEGQNEKLRKALKRRRDKR